MTAEILVLGQSGQVATELTRQAGPTFQVTMVGRDRINLAGPDAGATALGLARHPALVINAAAYTAVDRAETEEAEATAVNAAAPAAMARACAARDIPLLHISTDYVFDGSPGRAWREDDATGPLGVYGRSKLAGEQAVIAAGGPHVILRTAWVFAAHGQNFVKTMLRVGAGRDRLTVVDDQLGGPTPAAAIADALLTIAEAFLDGRGVSGVFHFAGAPPVTWCGFAREIFARHARLNPGAHIPEIAPIHTEDWPTPATRPRNSVLDCTKIGDVYGIGQPDWRAGLDAVLAELGETA